MKDLHAKVIYDLKYLINYSSLRLKEKLDEYYGYSIIGFGASHSTGMLVHMFNPERYLAFLLMKIKTKLESICLVQD